MIILYAPVLACAGNEMKKKMGEIGIEKIIGVQ